MSKYSELADRLLGITCSNQDLDDASHALRKLEARVAELEAALEDFGIHDSACALTHENSCDCGLSAALAGREKP